MWWIGDMMTGHLKLIKCHTPEIVSGVFSNELIFDKIKQRKK
jgi:hypothetical protein